MYTEKRHTGLRYEGTIKNGIQVWRRRATNPGATRPSVRRDSTIRAIRVGFTFPKPAAGLFLNIN